MGRRVTRSAQRRARRPTARPGRARAAFSPAVLAAIDATKYFRLRSGPTHRFIAVWVVVVDGRVLVRSWNNKPGGWFAAFLHEPRGEIVVNERPVGVVAKRVRSRALVEAANGAYAGKYATKANQKYVRGFATEGRMTNTMELVPARA